MSTKRDKIVYKPPAVCYNKGIGGDTMSQKRTLQEIDKNFAVKNALKTDGVKAYNVCEAPLKLYGLLPPQDADDKFRRIPEAVAKSVSNAVWLLHANTAGGRVRFRTDSSYIGIYAKLPAIGRMPHFALTGSAGFDLYRRTDKGERYVASFIPPFAIEDTLRGEVTVKTAGIQEYTVNFPLYSDVSEVYILLNEQATVLPPTPYENELPVVYYGSSITQGGCASRPGNAYQGMLSRRLGQNFLNLGFSGNALAEQEIADYIAGLSMRAFVFDYDHNAPTVEHLQSTHERLFNTVRAKHPALPIICASRPTALPNDKRVAVIRATVERARAAGDTHVYFIDMGEEIARSGIGDDFSVDGCHPTDLGFYIMANAFERVFRTIDNQN